MQRVQQKVPEVTFSPPPDMACWAVVFEYCRRFFRGVEKAGLRCIIMLDHFEALIENLRLDHGFLEGLRAMNSMYQLEFCDVKGPVRATVH